MEEATDEQEAIKQQSNRDTKQRIESMEIQPRLQEHTQEQADSKDGQDAQDDPCYSFDFSIQPFESFYKIDTDLDIDKSGRQAVPEERGDSKSCHQFMSKNQLR